MDELICSEFKLGRRFLGRLPHGKDLITSIENFCKASAYTDSNIFRYWCCFVCDHGGI